MKTKNKFIIIALVCLITISSVWAGRTYAYFTASSNASGTITMGTLKVNDFGELDAETNLKVVPNQTVTKNFKATVESDIKYYKRLSLSAEVKAETGKTHETTCGDYVDDDTKILNATVANFEKYTTDDGTIYYYGLTPVTPTNSTTEEEFAINIAVHDWVGAGGCDYYMGATIYISVKIEVIQADYLEDNGLAKIFTKAADLHSVWTNILSPVQDVSEYPNLSFSILSEDDKTMSVSAANTSITEANIPARVMSEGKIYDVSKIGQGAFNGCSSLASIAIPNGVTSIGSLAFWCCSSLKTIIIPNSVRSLGESCFAHSGLKSITLSDSVTSISWYCFAYSGLKSITIPASVTSIDGYCFAYSDLESITIPSTVKDLFSHAFSYSSATVYLSRGCESASATFLQDFRGTIYYDGTVAEMATICPGDSGGSSSATIICADGNYVFNYRIMADIS